VNKLWESNVQKNQQILRVLPERGVSTAWRGIRLALVTLGMIAGPGLASEVAEDVPTSSPSVDRSSADASVSTSDSANNSDALLEQSPLFRRWRQEVPDVRSQIRHDPAFRTRLRAGYSHFPDAEEEAGFHLGVEDVFIDRTGLTVSGLYQGTFDEDEAAWGADLRYYVLPLGNYVNVAPVVGYRHLTLDGETSDGVHLGARLMISLSRTGAADLALAHGWVTPGTDEEVGISTLSLGYAVSDRLRLSTDLQRWGSRQGEDHRLGIGLEWMP
jgi:hypothetical protein